MALCMSQPMQDLKLARRETRREKSRDAARCRRKNESDAFDDICEILPVATDIVSQLDRSAIIRLLISFLKLRNKVDAGEAIHSEDVKEEVSMLTPPDTEYVDALNGFIMVLSGDYDMLYLTENVKTFLGLPDLDLIGQSLLAYCHEGDHSVITDSFKEVKSEERISFMLRMRSTLTSTGKNINLKSSAYKVVKCEGVIQVSETDGHVMVLYCEPIPHPANIEMVLDSQTFLSQHSLDMKFTYCDDRASELIGYEEDDLNSKSLFDLCHTSDIKHLDDVAKKLFRLGQVSTDTYRLLAKYGGYHHVVTQATVINNPKNNKPSYIVCVHHVISQLVDPDLVLSLDQLKMQELKQIENIKQEFVENEKETVPINLTDSLFSDFDPSELIYNSTDETLTEEIPFNIDLVALAQNAPSIGDDFDFSNINFAELANEDLVNNIFNAAPSIGDPSLDSPQSTIDTDKLLEWFSNMDQTTGAQNSPSGGRIDWEQQINTMDTYDQDQPSTSGLQCVKLPKNDFVAHMKIPQVLKRQQEQEKFVKQKRQKLDLGEPDQRIFKQRYPSLFDLNENDGSLNDATKFFLGEENMGTIMG